MKNALSENAKIASVKPICKKADRTNIENYRPASILNSFSKICERFPHKTLFHT